MQAEFDFYEVGGAVRDSLLGITSKDVDFTVVDNTPSGDLTWSFRRLEKHLTDEGYEIFLSTPEYLTIRARFPKGHPLERTTADFVLARREGPYGDGRRPDWVVPGSLHDDLSRRDFTVNAIARKFTRMLDIGEPVGQLPCYEIIDPFGGEADLEAMILRCVGSAEDRLTEDALRALRAIRFRVTKGFTWDRHLRQAMTSLWLPKLLHSVSAERKREELDKCFKVDTLQTLEILCHELPPEFLEAVFCDGLRLRPTMEK